MTNKKYKSMIIVCFAALPFFVNAQEINEIQYRKIFMEDYADKVGGGWLGQAIGVLYGQWTEGKWQGEIVPFDLEDWYMLDPEIQKKAETIIKEKAIKDNLEKRAVYHCLGINDKENWKRWNPEMMPDQDDLYVEYMVMEACPWLQCIVSRFLKMTRRNWWCTASSPSRLKAIMQN
jgi:hypothetical protein